MPESSFLTDISPSPALVFDAAKFQHLFDDPSVTSEEGEAFLKAIWDIIVIILDFGLRLEFPETSPQEIGNRPKALDAALNDMIYSKDIETIDEMDPPSTLSARSVREEFDESR